MEASYEYIDEAHDKTENHASNIQSMTDEEKLILMSFSYLFRLREAHRKWEFDTLSEWKKKEKAFTVGISIDNIIEL